MTGEELHYDEAMISFLEEMWGEGHLSPGGPEELARMLSGLDLSGKNLLDIGCGPGGVTLSLARDYNAASIVGVDVERPVCEQAQARIKQAGFADRIEICLIQPGPLPFADESFDIVFSKDAIVHIPDKEALAREAFRLLRPGGWFVASDWLIAHDEDPSREMKDYLTLENLGFGMASPGRYQRALEAAGFEEVELASRNQWYLETAKEELQRLQGPSRSRFETVAGAAFVDANIATWKAMLVVLESGEHCPHHFRGRKPM